MIWRVAIQIKCYKFREILNIFRKELIFAMEKKKKMYGTLRLVNSREIEYQVDGAIDIPLR